ncbi:MAG TPA: lipopolysaccharide heptosyltransferase II [Capsulimonadaceae bacterium]|jgi:lipopolysaccharide heptosyltransferase I
MESGALKPSRLLVVKMSSIGDIAHALPVVSQIKRALPNLFIGWVVKRRCASLLEGNPDIDKLYVTSDKPGASELLGLRKQMRADRYDTAIDMQGLLLSGVVTWLSGAKRRVGLDRNREGNFFFLTEHTVPGKDPDRHAIDILSGFAHSLGVDYPEGSVPVQSYLATSDSAFAHEHINALHKPIIALNAGASTIYKQWPADHWAELGKAIVAGGASVVLLGGPRDVETVDQISGIIASHQCVNLAGKTNLRQLASVVACCDLMVSGDTGPIHIAVDVGTPCVGLYGPTNPRAYGPYGNRNVVIWKGLPCSPCHRNPTCNGRVDCMKRISATDVLKAIEKLIPGTLGDGPRDAQSVNAS